MSIIIDHLSYKYKDVVEEDNYALRDINLKIEDGEFVGLIGHTGSGKSTLMQHLNGLEKATEGTIYYNGKDIYDKDYDMRRLREKVGLVFQYPEYQLFETTIFKDISFGPKNLGLPQLEVDLRSYEAMRDVGLSEELIDVSPFTLSGGQKRRVAIAGVLAMKPEVLILDEPTAGLDPEGREEILHLVKNLHEERKCTIILVSHSMEDMADYVQRLIVMHEGRVVLDGNKRDVFAHEEELRMLGLAVPQVTSLMNQLKKRGYTITNDILTIEEAKEELLRIIGKSI
ncbi:MAG: energy-coupling factor transporter ATPase [Lachnospiraceae bacterium]|nr:energy-coupling factor transporter ATPase [Lachnospiraceae bacterium]